MTKQPPSAAGVTGDPVNRRIRFSFVPAALVLLMWTSLTILARDALRQPFHEDSIWNRPIGSEAIYVHANIQKATARGMTVDEDLIVLTPDAPLLDVYRNDAGWNRNRSRCTIDGGLLFRVPIPADFIVSPDTWDGLTPNSGLAVLMPDGRTLKQTQPFARCTPGYGTSRYLFADEDLYGLGYHGAHGGSGLSCIGGTLRVGELVPGAGPIRHALKVNLHAARNLYYDEETGGYRWPARRADGYAARVYGTQGKPEKACRMGALLALPPSIVIGEMGLETEPARMLAEAFQDYGAYVVDDTAWDVFALVTEWGPKGRVLDEFERAWGFPINPRDRDNAWSRDMDRIFTSLHVVDNNGPDRIGGGGRPRAPLARPLDPPVRRIDLRPHWNDRVPLQNPHKGWYHHYPDNHINKYLIHADADLLEFPGVVCGQRHEKSR
jgi:hypothetical protein